MHDVLTAALPEGYDVVMTSLFLHHLERDEAARLLAAMRAAARRLVVIDDLRRDGLGLALAWLGSRTLTRSPVVRVDGPRSVRAAFTITEVRRLAEAAGWSRDLRVRTHWPRRFLLTASAA